MSQDIIKDTTVAARVGGNQPTEYLIKLDQPIIITCLASGTRTVVTAAVIIVHPAHVDGWWFTDHAEAQQSWDDLGEIDVEKEP